MPITGSRFCVELAYLRAIRLKLGCSESHLIAGAAAETLNKPSLS
jgi:hypothetical protein